MSYQHIFGTRFAIGKALNALNEGDEDLIMFWLGEAEKNINVVIKEHNEGK